MAEIINFPRQGDYYLNLAKKSLSSNQVDLALSYLKHGLNLSEDLPLLNLYIELLLATNQIDLAQKTGSHYYTTLVKSEASRILLAKVYLQVDEFDQVEHLMKDYVNHSTSDFQKNWEAIDQELNYRIERFYSLGSTSLSKVVKNLSNLGAYDFSKQFSIIQDSKQLSLEELTQQARWILIHPDIKAPLKVALIENLIHKGDLTSYQYQKFDGLILLDLSSTKSFNHHSVVKQVFSIVNHDYEKNPSLQAILKEQIIIYLAYFYPDFYHYFEDAREIINVLLKRYNHSVTSKVNSKLEKSIEQIDKDFL